MRILFVVQRYGQQIIGGAELHCRLIAEHLAPEHEVEIATTCAVDYLKWENICEPGICVENGISVHRFPVVGGRPRDFDVLAHNVLYGYPTQAEEIEYLNAQGPVCPALVDFLKSRNDVDRFVLFSYRYWTTWHALAVVGNRSILVPTAENDRTLQLKIHRDSFHRPRAIAFNSPEERTSIRQISGNSRIPGVTVGVGLEEISRSIDIGIPILDIPRRYFLYIGRIEEAKGCQRLLQDYMVFHQTMFDPPALVFIGKQEIPIPEHPGIFCLGVQPDYVKSSVLRHAVALVMPSRYESLSMVLLEAWREGRPVIVNGKCDVLIGQCMRSGGGLFYRNPDEFIEVMSLLSNHPEYGQKMGEQGRRYFSDNYSWPVILEKYQRLLSFHGDPE